MAITFDSIGTMISACADSLELGGRVTHTLSPNKKTVYLHLNFSRLDILPKNNSLANTKARLLIKTIYSMVENLLKKCTSPYTPELASLDLSHTAVSGKVLFGMNKKDDESLWNRIYISLSRLNYTNTEASVTTINRLHELTELKTAIFDDCDKIIWTALKTELTTKGIKSNLTELSLIGQTITSETVIALQKHFQNLIKLTCTEKKIVLSKICYSITALNESAESSEEDMSEDSEGREIIVYIKKASRWARYAHIDPMEVILSPASTTDE